MSLVVQHEKGPRAIAGAAALFLASGLLLAGCTVSQPCDDDQVYEFATCFPKPPTPIDSGAGTSTASMTQDASIDDASLADAGPVCEPYEGFGVPCSDISECTCDTNFCPPGWPQLNYCTRATCMADPSVCPPGWRCEDLSRYSRELPSVCVKP